MNNLMRVPTDQLTHPTAADPWPAHGLESLGACPVCDSSEREVMYDHLRDQVFFCAPGTWTLYRCRVCGTGYLDPRPTPETISLAYARYHTHSDGRQDSENLRGLLRLRRALTNGYRNARFGTRLTPANRLGRWVTPLFPGRIAAIEAEARHLPRPRTGAALLDVGSGNGAFLEIASAMGWEAVGVEPDPKAVQVSLSRGLRVFPGHIDSLETSDERFDVITMGQVIEHVHSPKNLLATCFRLLKPGGLLWIDTPNLGSAGHGRYGRHWRGLEPPRHLVLFTCESLQLLMERSGFEEVELLPPRPLARRTFPASVAMRRDKDPYRFPDKSLAVRLSAWWADFKGKWAPGLREYVTVKAKRPAQGSAFSAAAGARH